MSLRCICNTKFWKDCQQLLLKVKKVKETFEGFFCIEKLDSSNAYSILIECSYWVLSEEKRAIFILNETQEEEKDNSCYPLFV